MAAWWELLGKVLSFLGGFVLTLDALNPGIRIKAEAGIRTLQDLLVKAGEENLLTDSKGNPLSNEDTFQHFLSRQPRKLARVGFVLVTLGFLLDMLVQLSRIYQAR